jgi:methyl-accepting chemotaxis protein
MDAVDDLEVRLEGLEDDLDAAGKVGERVDKVSERLWASLGKLRKSLEEVRSGAGEAAANADAALVRAEQAARDLALLGNRYDYHLRRYHGGG